MWPLIAKDGHCVHNSIETIVVVLPYMSSIARMSGIFIKTMDPSNRTYFHGYSELHTI